MKDTTSKVLPMNLQFFAEGGAGATEGTGAPAVVPAVVPAGTEDDKGAGEASTKAGNQTQQTNSGEKTFTQAQVSAMMATEKEEGRRSALKIFGVTDPKIAKEEATKYAAWAATQKTETEKVNTLTSEKSAAEKRAEYSENKLTAFGEGVKLEVVDDVVTIAMSKVTESKDLKAVIAEMKKSAAYASFFTESTTEGSSNGTGTGVNSGKGTGTKVTGMGARLAAAGKPATTTKSSYFSN